MGMGARPAISQIGSKPSGNEKPFPSRLLGKGRQYCQTPHAPPPFREGCCVRQQRRVTWLQQRIEKSTENPFLSRPVVATVAGQRRTLTGFPPRPLAPGLRGISAVLCDCEIKYNTRGIDCQMRQPSALAIAGDGIENRTPLCCRRVGQRAGAVTGWGIRDASITREGDVRENHAIEGSAPRQAARSGRRLEEGLFWQTKSPPPHVCWGRAICAREPSMHHPLSAKRLSWASRGGYPDSNGQYKPPLLQLRDSAGL